MSTILNTTTHVLKNGLTVIYCQNKHSSAFEISLHINTGARDETKEKGGVSHFLEHMLFRGSKRHPNSLLLAEQLESFGGETNAMTGVEHTHYWLKGDSERTLAALACFYDFAFHPNYADLETERNIILQEMASDFNEEGECIDSESLAMQALFDTHPLGNPIIGSEESVRRLSIVDFEEKRRTFYIPNRCILTLATHLDESAVLPHIESLFGQPWEHVRNDTPSASRPPAHLLFQKEKHKKPQNGLQLQNNPDNQFVLKFILPTVGGLDRDVIRTTFLQRILDDGISTRLSANLRERHGLIYDISCDTQFFYEMGTFGIDATVSEENLDKLLIKLKDELARLLNEKPSKKEMDHIRYRYCFDLKQIQENDSRLLNREAIAHFMRPSYLSLQEEMAIVNALTEQDILNTAQTLFSAPKRGFTLIGPKARRKRDPVEKFLSSFDGGTP